MPPLASGGRRGGPRARWFFTTADGIVVEGHGIPPHREVPASPADFDAGVDPVLDFAEAWAADPVIRRGP